MSVASEETEGGDPAYRTAWNMGYAAGIKRGREESLREIIGALLGACGAWEHD